MKLTVQTNKSDQHKIIEGILKNDPQTIKLIYTFVLYYFKHQNIFLLFANSD